MSREWQFDEESETLDLDRLHRELLGIPYIVALEYMGELAENAPIVYKRYRDRNLRRTGKHQIWNWEQLDKRLKEPSK